MVAKIMPAKCGWWEVGCLLSMRPCYSSGPRTTQYSKGGSPFVGLDLCTLQFAHTLVCYTSFMKEELEYFFHLSAISTVK